MLGKKRVILFLLLYYRRKFINKRIRKKQNSGVYI